MLEGSPSSGRRCVRWSSDIICRVLLVVCGRDNEREERQRSAEVARESTYSRLLLGLCVCGPVVCSCCQSLWSATVLLCCEACMPGPSTNNFASTTRCQRSRLRRRWHQDSHVCRVLCSWRSGTVPSDIEPYLRNSLTSGTAAGSNRYSSN